MSILSDRGISEMMARGFMLVWRMLKRAQQPSSVDVRLGPEVLTYRENLGPDFVIETKHQQQDIWDRTTLDDLDGFILPPGGFALAVTRERINVPDTLCGFLAGRSGMARLGLQVEAAGLLDPGYTGCPTLELFNMAPYPIRLTNAMPIGQVYFITLDQAAEFPYGHQSRTSRYQGDTYPMPSKMWKEART